MFKKNVPLIEDLCRLETQTGKKCCLHPEKISNYDRVMVMMHRVDTFVANKTSFHFSVFDVMSQIYCCQLRVDSLAKISHSLFFGVESSCCSFEKSDEIIIASLKRQKWAEKKENSTVERVASWSRGGDSILDLSHPSGDFVTYSCVFQLQLIHLLVGG